MGRNVPKHSAKGVKKRRRVWGHLGGMKMASILARVHPTGLKPLQGPYGKDAVGL